MEPSSGSIRADSIFSSVVFPEPLVPMRPIFSEGLIWKVASRSTSREPKAFD